MELDTLFYYIYSVVHGCPRRDSNSCALHGKWISRFLRCISVCCLLQRKAALFLCSDKISQQLEQSPVARN